MIQLGAGQTQFLYLKMIKMKTTLFLFIACFAFNQTTFSQTKNNNKMNTIVLVHGAWLDASAWQDVMPYLKNQNNEVIAITLPGHGSDSTSFDKIQLQSYVDAVKKAIGSKSNVILVGHSMAGLVISETAEQLPSQIKKLVYVGAFLPRNGESLLSLASQAENSGSLLGKYQLPDQKTGSITVATDGFVPTFAADVSKEQSSKMLASLKADPLMPFVTPVILNKQNFGSIPKVYVYTQDDKAIDVHLQELMVKNSDVEKTYSIPSSHVPFFSMPGVLAAIIQQEVSN